MVSPEKLRWRCRRGTLELDLILQRYLDSAYLHADDEEKTRFTELLGWEDDELLAVFLSGQKPPEGYAALIEKMRRISVASN